MRRLPFLKLFVLLFCSFIVFYIYTVNIRKTNKNISTNVKHVKNLTSTRSLDKEYIDRIVISFVVCETRFNQSLNVIKSALIFTKTPLYFVIFTDEVLRLQFNETLTKWKLLSNNQFNFELQRIKFPEAHEEDWLNLFSKCAAQRLFIPKLIPHIDAMIYVDTDTLFLGPVDELWHTFTKMNSTQISAMTLEDDNPNVSWYPRFAKHPFYGKYGLNSGVMLMNLTRMRDFGWVDYVTPIMLKWKLYIPWGDQDIINIIFHYHPGAVRVLSCRYNYRSDQCMYGDACADASRRGVFALHGSRGAFHSNKQPAFQDIINIIFHYHPGAVRVLSCRYNYRSDQCMYGDACADASRRGVFALHGSRGAFHSNKQPAFQAIYDAINEYKIGTDPMAMLNKMDRYLTDAPKSLCGNLKDAFLKVPIEVLTKNYTRPDR